MYKIIIINSDSVSQKCFNQLNELGKENKPLCLCENKIHGMTSEIYILWELNLGFVLHSQNFNQNHGIH